MAIPMDFKNVRSDWMSKNIDQKRAYIIQYCNANACLNCKYNGDVNDWCAQLDPFSMSEEDVIRVYDDITAPNDTQNVSEKDTGDNTDVPKEIQHDAVNHPSHYTNGGMECIDEMILLFGSETVKHFCLCNAWKYRRRALYKSGEEDIKKSHWYINKYKELVEGEPIGQTEQDIFRLSNRGL